MAPHKARHAKLNGPSVERKAMGIQNPEILAVR
jgi:hypothetical protein